MTDGVYDDAWTAIGEPPAVLNRIVLGLWQSNNQIRAEDLPPNSIVIDLSGNVSMTVARTHPVTVYRIQDAEFDPSWEKHLFNLARLAAQAMDVGMNVVVACGAGRNRSGLLSALILIERGERPELAIDLVRKARGPTALNNGSFTAWLMRQGESLQHDLARWEAEGGG